MDQNGVIGRGGQLPWRLSADLKHFKQLTMGHALVMGRRTYESIGRALPGRVSIVITRSPTNLQRAERVLVAESLELAVDLVSTTKMNQEEVFVIGGADIYRLALPMARRLHITRVLAAVDGDVYFPVVSWDEWKLLQESLHTADAQNEYDYSFQLFERSY